MDPIPVTIIAGSFACGKTTLCNQLLGTLGPAQRNVAVISHRFAEECLTAWSLFVFVLLIIYIVDHLWGLLIVWHCSLSLTFPWEDFAISRYACQPVVLHESHCGLLEEVYDYGSGCLCCTPGGELNQRLNNMMMWGRFAGKKAAYPDPLGDS